MTEFQNRKQANVPTGYVAVYGQNGITYKLASYEPRKERLSFNWTPLLLALVVVAILAAAIVLPNLSLFM